MNTTFSHQHPSNKRWIVALTGASGMKYALRLIECAAESLSEVHVIASEAALRVLNEEESLKLSAARLNTQSLFGRQIANIKFHNVRDIGAGVASGSFLFDGMVVVPCSMASLGAIANGVASNLIHRAAEVSMKENRKLILVPRETPLSAIHLDNMARLARSGVCILPAMPGFYHRPASIKELVDMLVMKILDQMGISNDLTRRWKDAGSDGNTEKIVKIR